MVSVAQFGRALDCDSSGRGFESHRSPHSFLSLLDKWFGFKCLMNPSRLKFPLKIHIDSNSPIYILFELP